MIMLWESNLLYEINYKAMLGVIEISAQSQMNLAIGQLRYQRSPKLVPITLLLFNNDFG